MTLPEANRPGARRRALTAATTALATAAAVIALADDPAAAATRRWAGFAIRSNGHADGGWLGGRTLGDGARVYRLQPRKGAAESAYRSARRTTNLAGRHAPGATATRRAAWILSRYGTYHDDYQSAAVDVAVYALLAGGPWRMGHPRAAARLRQSGYAAYVRPLARTMLDRSRRQAGPYTATLTASRATVGSSTRVSLRVRTRGGTPLAGARVTFGFPGQRFQRTFTDKGGRATAYFSAVAGRTRVTATITHVPEWRLHVRAPLKRGASAVAVAGRHATLVARATAVGVSPQAVSVANTRVTIRTGAALAGSYTVTGGYGTRTATLAVYGPAASAPVACSGAPAYTGTQGVDSAGSRSLPAYRPARSGYYAWRAAVSGNDTSTPAAACGAAVRVQRPSRIGQYRVGKAAVAVGRPFRVGVRISGFDRRETHTVTSTLYGPFKKGSGVRCWASKVAAGHAVTATVTGSTSRAMPPTTINRAKNAGYYGWRSSLSAGNLIRGSRSGCGVVVHVTK